MLEPLEKYAVGLTRGATVFFEVPSTAGVPDVVALALDLDAIADRGSTTPLLEPVQMRIMLGMTRPRNPLSRVWSVDGLSEIAGVGATHLRRSVLPQLVDGNHLVRDNEGWRIAYRYRSLARRTITIEAKLRDWRGAVSQASRHAGVADAAWVALDEVSSRTARRHESWFLTYGVGLLSVSPDGEVMKLIPPGERRSRKPGRELLVERAVALYREGRRSGDVPIVFGERLLATTGADPRLLGAAAS
ncbi:hypothetical protein [Microbacterium sp. SS28]|uniref:hypothetical protein n=1 Tax=Microbacterium sp. SS28 TaxID=2919948 RepID=UPI001FAB21DD|nr:hypothetical protein [Microbacterium sp. SS28]